MAMILSSRARPVAARWTRIALLALTMTLVMALLPASPGLAGAPGAPASAAHAPAVGPRLVAEWEPAIGSLIRWPLGIPLDLVRHLAADDTLYTLVETGGQEQQARSAFAAAGVDLSRVQFIHADLWSMWTRDWGPQAMFRADGVMAYADPWFDGYPWVPGCHASPGGGVVPPSGPTTAAHVIATAGDPGAGIPETVRAGRGYDEDDALPAVVAAHLGVPRVSVGAYLTGGNIMTDGLGLAWSTSQMLAENAPYLDEAAFRQHVGEVLGLTDYRLTIDPEIHGIQHIDCYAKLLDEETVLVKAVPAGHPEHGCCEEVAAAFAGTLTPYGRPYTVHRVFCPPYDGDATAAYTNSLILGRKVLVPLFGLPADADALATYRDTMPGYDVIGIPYDGWHHYDALHCRVMGLFDPGMLRLLHARVAPVQPAGQPARIAAWIDDRSGSGLPAGDQAVRWRLVGEAAWQEVALTAIAAADSFEAWIPAQPPGSEVEYRLHAADASGRLATLPRGAEPAAYRYTVDGATGVVPDPDDGDGGAGDRPAPPLALTARPNPFNPRVEIRLEDRTGRLGAGSVTVTICDLRGRRIRTLHDGPLPTDPRLVWDGTDHHGRALASGVYLAIARGAGPPATVRLVLQR